MHVLNTPPLLSNTLPAGVISLYPTKWSSLSFKSLYSLDWNNDPIQPKGIRQGGTCLINNKDYPISYPTLAHPIDPVSSYISEPQYESTIKQVLVCVALEMIKNQDLSLGKEGQSTGESRYTPRERHDWHRLETDQIIPLEIQVTHLH
jgi:hypothetical protein